MNLPQLHTAVLTAVLAATLSSSLFALDSVLSGVFDGSEPTTGALPGGCGSPDPLAYQEVDFQVEDSGEYDVTDAYNSIGTDVTALIYRNNFNPGNPQNNLETPDGIDAYERVELDSGTQYVLVVQHWCKSREGAWAVTFTGPGEAMSTAVRNVPNFTSGTFAGSDPTVDSACGSSGYQTSGPVTVSEAGTYYYMDVSINFGVDMCLQVYDAPFNAGDPDANLIGAFDDFGEIELETGQSYYFVMQPLAFSQLGDYFFIFAPPAPFRLNGAMSGSWYNPATAGQGFFMDVFDNINQVFLAWFTYDLARPDASVVAQIGDPGHRWLTAFGPFSGNSAMLDIEWTVGGVFDTVPPAPAQSVDGSIEVIFNGCLSGTVDYDLGTAGGTGVVPIQRIANDSLNLCEELTIAPGQPGPL